MAFGAGKPVAGCTNQTWYALLLVAILCNANSHAFAKPPRATRPHIVFILADDLGWGDLSCYGNHDLKTPHLDKLAAGGTLFTNFYVSASVCSPSRCAFFTGQYPARQKIHGHFATREQNAARGMSQFLDPAVPNLAQLLKQAGYRTAHVGKWHLGSRTGGPQPDAYGFDFVGTCETEAPEGPQGDPWFRANSTARFVDETLEFLRRNREHLCFVQLWTLVPHATLNPTPEQLQHFEKLSNPEIAHKSARTIYYASVSDLDRQVGRLMDELEKLGLAQDTLIVFSSDNGPEDIHVLNAGHSGVGSAGPFRGRKRSLYEGGVRVPLIVRWPGHIPAGRVNDSSVIAGVDLLPTVAALAKTDVPASFRIDGEDMSDILLGAGRDRRQPLFWEWRFGIAGEVFHRSPMLAVRSGDWKLYLNPDRSRLELYDMPRDPTQLNNLAEKNPELVERLSRLALDWQATLPQGPRAPGAGQTGYPWPKSTDQ